jgi:hypothetical protein
MTELGWKALCNADPKIRDEIDAENASELPGFDDVEGAIEKANDIWATRTFRE